MIKRIPFSHRASLLGASFLLFSHFAMPARAVDLSAFEQSFIQSWQARGYFSQTYTNTSDPINYGGESVDGALDIRNLGLNLSNDYLLKNARFAAQATYRDFGNLDDGDVELDFLVLDIALMQDLDYRLGVEIGRLKTDIAFFVSGWDVAHARPFVLLPITLYEESYREFMYSADGVRGALRFYGGGYWQLELFYGKPSGDPEKFTGIFRQDILDTDLRIDDIGDLYGAGVKFESDSGLFSSYVAYANSETPIAFGPLADFGLAPRDGAADLSWSTAGAKLNYAQLYFIAEIRYGEVDVRSALPLFLLPVLPPNSLELAFLKPFSYYVAAGYRILNQLEFYAYFGETWADLDDPRGRRLARVTGVSESIFFVRTVSAGVRWDVTKSVMLGAQWHRIHGHTVLSDRDNANVFDLPEQWDMLNLTFSYRF